MAKKLLFLILTIVLLTMLSVVYIVDGTQAYFRYQQTSIARQQQCGGQSPVHICVLVPRAIFSAYYPSYLAAPLQNQVFTVQYSSNNPITLFIHLTINGFSQSQIKNVKATSTIQSEHFLPPLLKQGQVLDGLTSEVNTSLSVQVLDGSNHIYYSNDVPLLLHSRWLMQWTQANRLLIAAWVTPNDFTVEDLVQKARNHLQDQPPPIPSAMVGYKGTTQQQVRDEVDALYDTLRRDYHIKYVQESVPYADSTTSAIEPIKLPKEVLKQGSGMCIELTALLASAVERIGLHSEVVIVPGHAFLGVAVREDDSHFEYWDAVDMNNNVAADSANIDADGTYVDSAAQHRIVDTIAIGDARAAGVGPME